MEALESKDFKISHTKPKNMNRNFSGKMKSAKAPVKTEAQEIPQRFIPKLWLDN